MIFKAPEKIAIFKSGYGKNSIFFQYIHPWRKKVENRSYLSLKRKNTKRKLKKKRLSGQAVAAEKKQKLL